MALEPIISIIVFFVVLVLVWGFFKKLFKLLFYAGLIISLILAVNLYFIYQDFDDFRENFGVSEKKVILKDGDEILTGLILDEGTSLTTAKQLNEYDSYLRNEDYESILGDSYKLMVFDVDIISNLDEIEMDNELITQNEAIAILTSNDAEEKAVLFSVILAEEILSSRNPLFFLSEFKDGNIVIYPETAIFKTIKFLPLNFIEDLGKKIFEKGKAKAISLVEQQNI
jgi:hypothetical protein